MDWKTLPGYDEKYANISIKEHKTFGGKVITVLYGAKDAEGNPVMPAADKEDGHGTWFGIESNGNVRMFSLQHPASEGGAVEYGTAHKENALEDMEAVVAKKYELCKEADGVARSMGADAKETLAKIKEEWDKLEEWDTLKEKEYDTWFKRVTETYEERENESLKNAEEKQGLVEKAKALVESQDWKATQQAFRNLFDQWREIGHAGVKDDELWGEFKAARDSFDEKRKSYFENLDQVHEENKVKKEELVKKAKEVVATVENWKESSTVMNNLMEAWRNVKSAGHDADDTLWAEFNGARQAFYAGKKEFYEKRDAEKKASIDAKNALIAEAKEIGEKADFSKQVTERMKQLDIEWKKAGYSGKDDNDRLWDEFKAAKDIFWCAKHDDSQKRFQTLIEKKDAQIKSMREKVNELEEKVFQTEDRDRIRSLQREAEDKKLSIESLKKDIEDLKGKLDK